MTKPHDPDVTAGALTAGSLLDTVPPFVRKSPEWVKREGFNLVGAWESIQFYRRSNQAIVGYEPFYEHGHSEAFVLEAKAMGANCIITHFNYKFGLQEQREQLEKAKAFAGLCHKHGMKVGGYFRVDSICPESLVGAERDFLKCVQRDDRGPVGFASYLHGVCYHHPEALELLKTWIRWGVEDYRLDILHFDGFIFGGMEGMGVACRCERCRADFTAFLAEKYGGDRKLAQERFGHTQIQNIEPPVHPDGRTRVPGVPRGPITDVVWQEWIQFRCLWGTYLARAISHHVAKHYPETAIEINSCQGVRENDALNYGLDHPTYAGLFDGYWAEDGYSPELLPTGELITRIRHCKYVRNAGGTLIVYLPVENPRKLRMSMAHNAAFNEGSIGCLGFAPGMPFDFRTFADTKREFLAWRREHSDYFTDVAPLSEVAVWRGQKAIAFGAGWVACASMRVEQWLIEDRIPFNIVADDWLDKPGPERMLILPDVECVTEPQGEAIERFVRAGGGLIVGQDSSRFDGWRRRRLDFLLRPLLGPEAGRDGTAQAKTVVAETPAGYVTMVQETGRGKAATYFRYGKGRVVYVPEIMDPAEQRPTVNDRFQYDFDLDYSGWRAPRCVDDLRRALRWCLDDRSQFRVDAERGVVAEFGRQSRPQRHLVHLVNLTPQPTRIVRVTAHLPEGQAPAAVDIVSPDPGGAGKHEVERAGNRITIELERLDVYAIVSIRIKGSMS